MEIKYQFAHESDTLLGKFEHEWHRNFGYADRILDRFPTDVPSDMIELHSVMEETSNCFVICRDIAGCVDDVNDLRRQIGQRLTEAKIRHLRSVPGNEQVRWRTRVDLYTEAFTRIVEAMGA